MRFAPFVVLAVCSPAFAAVHVAQHPNPHDRFFEQLPDLRLVRGAQPKDIPLDVTADAAEGWTITVDEPWLEVTPASGTGPATVTLRFDGAALDALQAPSAHVTITGADDQGGTNVDGIDVGFDIWPNLTTASTPDELRAYARDPANWPKDGFGGSWELWGFLPDETTHSAGAGANIDAWEKTPCPPGAAPDDQTCVHPGQAGLAAGMSADTAWILSTGDPRVVIAELDSGIKWDDRDLTTKFYLNARELASCPPPGAALVGPTDDPFVVYDVNHDGVFNIRDYDAADWLTDVNGNGIRDPEDLIWGTFTDGTACSDGVDADGNGYVDDIAGWDFFWNDNDPSDDADFGHGTGEANDSTAEAHDGGGTPGVCPRCRVMPVRVGDSFITDSNHFADGAVFAVESGASVVQEALGTINATAYAQQAIDWAYGHGVPIIASAADETSYHHNPPATLEHTFSVHAIVWDDDGSNDELTAHTFLNFNNCTNFGSHLMLSTPGTGCSSEATGKTAGETGLLMSYFRQLQDGGDPYYAQPLSAEEVYQVLVASADDIDVPGAHDDASAKALEKFPSNPGWDLHFGYGRNNARRALEALRDKKIPAEANISSPTWFTVFDPTRTPSFDVVGHVGSPRDSDLRWELHVSEGAVGKSFTKIAEGTGPVDGKLGTLDLSAHGPLAALVARAADPAGSDPDQFTATFELRTFAKNPAGDEVRGVFRKAFGVRIDPDVQDGFPLYLGASGESSPKITDVDGDGSEEIVVATSDGVVHAVGKGGIELPGFPAQIGTYSPFSDAACAPGGDARKCHKGARPYTTGAIDASKIGQAPGFSVAVGDLDGSGKLCRDIVIDTLDGFVFAMDCHGNPRAGFPVEIDRTHLPDGLDGARRCTDDNGNALIGCRSEQQFGQSGFIVAPTLVDLDGDGSLEIVMAGMDEWVYAWHADGSEVNGWPVHVENAGIPAFNPDGSPLRFVDRIVSSPAVADVFGDGTQAIFVGTNERVDNSPASFLYGIWPDGNAHEGGPFLPHWPATLTGLLSGQEILPFVGRGNPNSPAAADIDGDGKDEVICAGLGGALEVLGADPTRPVLSMGTANTDYGELATSHELLSLPVISNPSVADLDGDGRLELNDGTVGSGLLQVAQQGGRRHDFDHSVGVWVADNGKFQAGFPQKIFDYQFFMNYSVADLEGNGLANVLNGDGGYFVYAQNANGQEAKGWPKWTMQWDITTPAVGDLDGDQNIDVAMNTREGWLWAWKTKGNVGGPQNAKVPAIQWESFHHDDHNTGNYKGPLKPYPRLEPADDSCSSGCCCSASRDTARTTPVLGALALGALAATMGVRRRRRGGRRGGAR